MPQTFHVLLCVICKTYQVHIVKKANKWNCKICDSKQSVQKVFATGTGAECRDIVQRLNEARGKLEDNRNEKTLAAVAQEEEASWDFADDGESHDYPDYTEEPQPHHQQHSQGLHNSHHNSQICSVPPAQSKWTKYLDESD